MPLDPPLQRVLADLRTFSGEARKEIRPTLKRAADAVVQTARRNAGWSSRIPRAIATRVRFGARSTGVHVVARAKAAPHARPYEGLGQPGTFRHPTWGGDPWVTQARRPFLWPAVQAEGEQTRAALADAVDQAARKAGFR